MEVDEIVVNLKKYFNLIKVISVLDYDSKLPELYVLLKSLRKDRYNHNDRIVFIFNDTEYYFINKHGFFLHNLQKIIYDLDIPNYFCLIITHQDYVKQEAQVVNNLYGHDSWPISVIELWTDVSQINTAVQSHIDLNLSLIDKSYIFLSRVARKHRVAFYSMLDYNNLLDKGLVSFSLNNSTNIEENEQPVGAYNSSISTLTTFPFTRTNEEWLLTNDNLRNIYSEFLRSVASDFTFKNFSEEKFNVSPAEKALLNATLTQQAVVYVAGETVCNYPGTYFSEKSFKGIAAKRPFLMLGPAGNLKQLKKYGFRTFNRWWDESYDDIEDSSDRIAAVFEIIKNISCLQKTELINLVNDMEDVLEYNFNFFKTEFTETQRNNLQTQCFTNLNRS